MEVKRICQCCGKPFIAQKTTTCYCSPQYSKRGYKHRIKERKMELRHIQEMQELRSSLEKQEYFTFSQAARLMGVSRQYIYKLVKEDKLRASRISGRMLLVRRADIELMLKSKPYERLVAKNNFDISEYYTPEEIQEKYGMTHVAIRSQVYRNNIPSKKEHGQIFYSKLHFDLSKNSEQESKAEYYTVKEAMEKFKLSRDSVYGILQFHQINQEKNGRFVRFLKVVGSQTEMTHISVNSWVKRFETEGITGLETRPGRGRKPIMDCSDEEAVRKAIEQDRQRVMKAKEEWQKASGKEASESTFRAFLSALARDIDV